MPADEDCIPLSPAGSTRQPNCQLDRLIATAPLINDAIDLVHVTAAGWAAEILRNDPLQLEIRKCSVFNRHLVYFFVGRTAFRIKDGGEPSPDVTAFPAAFVIRPDNLGNPAQVYPFDTGAGAKGLYRKGRQPGVYLQDHEITPNLDAVRRLISYSYGSYSNYLNGKLNPNLDERVPASEYVARAYMRIANLGGVGAGLPDRRSSTIEVAYDKNVPLAAHAALVVLPDALLQPRNPGTASAQLKGRLDALAVKYETYPWIPGKTPDQQMDEVDYVIRNA